MFEMITCSDAHHWQSGAKSRWWQAGNEKVFLYSKGFTAIFELFCNEKICFMQIFVTSPIEKILKNVEIWRVSSSAEI